MDVSSLLGLFLSENIISVFWSVSMSCLTSNWTFLILELGGCVRVLLGSGEAYLAPGARSADAREGARTLSIPKKKKFPNRLARISNRPHLPPLESKFGKMRASGTARWLNCRLLFGTQQSNCGSRHFNVSFALSASEGRRAFSQTLSRKSSAAQEA